ncbi:hypothetical protein SAMN05216339_1013 [Nitrosomonas eutropha]|uniref:Uncharacterized protein n=1 Tax=Nitrosomonas eutropha TaxID=916 RepID=A0A1I7ETH6_9PROT|nr:hypothetical protein [Nitrosomonas eutropha]SFU27247.1 hypothetical protein SAMN05216339_1013 [Nitrosomonas eutropha]
MDIKTYIEIGEKKAGKQIELARILGVRDSTLRLAKTGHAGLPAAICYQLAEYIGEEIGNVVAASNLVTEKDEKRRKVFEDYLKKSGENAARMIVGGLVISILSMTPQGPAEAASNGKIYENVNYTKLYVHVAGIKTPEDFRYVKSKLIAVFLILGCSE